MSEIDYPSLEAGAGDLKGGLGLLARGQREGYDANFFVRVERGRRPAPVPVLNVVKRALPFVVF